MRPVSDAQRRLLAARAQEALAVLAQAPPMVRALASQLGLTGNALMVMPDDMLADLITWLYRLVDDLRACEEQPSRADHQPTAH
jgi:hypothetical protein